MFGSWESNLWSSLTARLFAPCSSAVGILFRLSLPLTHSLPFSADQCYPNLLSLILKSWYCFQLWDIHLHGHSSPLPWLATDELQGDWQICPTQWSAISFLNLCISHSESNRSKFAAFSSNCRWEECESWTSREFWSSAIWSCIPISCHLFLIVVSATSL